MKKPMKILMVCHGNICRSPMAEFVMKKLVRERGLEDEFIIDSKATTRDDDGSDIWYEAKDMLRKNGIPFDRHYASRIRPDDYRKYDHIYIMDSDNEWEIGRIIPHDPEHKIEKLNVQDIADPWYSGDFRTAYDQICHGCMMRLEEILKG